MTDDKRKPGRPALPPGEKLVVVPVRLTETQKANLRRIGVQRLRDWLDRRKAVSMDDDSTHPLPEPHIGSVLNYYTADQMRNYAAEQVRELDAANAALKREAHTWSKAAEAYAKPRAPLTRQQIDDVMTQHYPLSSLVREEVDAFEACVRDLERLHGIGA